MIIKNFNYFENYELHRILNIVENNKFCSKNLIIIGV